MTSASVQELLQAALRASERAHAPYSGVCVGAALRCADGRVFTGCNVENASYGLTNCAERTALFKAVSEGGADFTAMAVAATGVEHPTPCGACRQVLAELCPSDMPVYVARGQDVHGYTVGELLPHPFELRRPEGEPAEAQADRFSGRAAARPRCGGEPS